MSFVKALFWTNWINRFHRIQEELITPNNGKVKQEAKKIDIPDGADDVERAKKVWLHIEDTITWDLTKKWQEPEELLETKVGDCEDMDFLMISMLPHVGVYNAKLKIGDLVKPSGGGGPHTWVVVDGVDMDPTGLPRDVKRIDYEPVHTFNIEMPKSKTVKVQKGI